MHSMIYASSRPSFCLPTYLVCSHPAYKLQETVLGSKRWAIVTDHTRHWVSISLYYIIKNAPKGTEKSPPFKSYPINLKSSTCSQQIKHNSTQHDTDNKVLTFSSLIFMEAWAGFLTRSSLFLARLDSGSGRKIKSVREHWFLSPLSNIFTNLQVKEENKPW